MQRQSPGPVDCGSIHRRKIKLRRMTDDVSGGIVQYTGKFRRKSAERFGQETKPDSLREVIVGPYSWKLRTSLACQRESIVRGRADLREWPRKFT